MLDCRSVRPLTRGRAAHIDPARTAPSWWWVPTVAWMAAIFALSSIPGSRVPGRWGYLPHFAEYAVLGLLAFLSLRRRSRVVRPFAVAILLASLYAASDELHQSFVPGRTPDVLDWAVDSLGAVAGAGVLALLDARRAARGGPSG